MVVDFVLKARVARGVCSRLSFEHDGATIGHDQSCPNQEYARLPKRDLAIINAYQTCALRDETNSSRWGIENIFSYLRRDLARQIGANSSDESGGNHGPSLNHERRSRLHHSVGTSCSSIDGGIDEREFAILTILCKRVVGGSRSAC